MKKIIALVLAALMVLACLSGLALADVEDYDLPYIVAPKKAVWQAKTAQGEEVYFLCLDTQHMEWAVEQEGGVTFTALKDSDFTPDGIEIPAEWDPANPIVIDLNGHSFTTRAGATKPQINMMGDGNLTLKNGTIKHVGKHRFLNLSRTTPGNVSQVDGHYYNPTLNLENLYINFALEDPRATNAPILESKMIHFTVNIKNCTLISDNIDFCSIGNFENISKDATFNIEDSILGAPSDRAFRLFGDANTAKITMNVKNSAFFNNEGQIAGGIKSKEINAMATVVPNWTATTPDGQTISSAAAVVGTAPTQTTIPTPVKVQLPSEDDGKTSTPTTPSTGAVAPKKGLELNTDTIIIIAAVAVAVAAVAVMLVVVLKKPKAKEETSAE